MHTLRMALAVFLTTSALLSFAQKPVITNISRTSAANQQVVTLEGQGFATPADLEVYFGAAKATIVPGQNSDQFLDVKVPAGTTYDKIAVRHKPSGLTEYSPQNFFLSFGGPHGISSTQLIAQKNFDSQSGLGLYDLCMCDFDGDGKTDVATANDESSASSITLLANTTTAPGLATMSFNGTPLNSITRTLHATCGDLNGDGKPEIVLTEGGAAGDEIFILRNTSTPGNFSFADPPQSVKITGTRVKRVRIADLDKDGKPELVVTNQSFNNITILVNQTASAATTFSFAQQTILISNAPPDRQDLNTVTNMDGIAIDDLDGDQLPEIILSQFLISDSKLFIVRNMSTPGNISLASNPLIILPIGGTVVNIKTGDLDGDQKTDIAVTQLLGSSISIFRNTSSPGNISFAAPVAFVTQSRPWGLDFGDLDGDGKADIVVTSITSLALSILNNNSTPGSFSFQSTTRATTFIQRHLQIGDVDGDAKPDIVFTSIDDNNNGITASKISVIRNAHCVQPVIDPAAPQTVCAGFAVQLATNVNPGTTYEWKNGAAVLATGPNSFYDVDVSAAATFSITVKATSEGGSCALTSTPGVSVTVVVPSRPLTGPANPRSTTNAPVCAGSTLTLKADDVDADTYQWTGPAGYSGTTTDPAPIPNFQEVNAGRYTLDMIIDGCIAGRESTVVEIVPVPDFQINAGGSSIVCAPATKTLSIVPNRPDFDYRWFEQTAGDLGVTTPTHNVTASGRYRVEFTLPGCITGVTDPVEITFATPPAAGFSLPPKACKGEDITFTNTTVTDGSVTTDYFWEFGDGNTIGLSSPVKKYNNSGTFTVRLTASYPGGVCTDIHTSTIIIEQATPSSITTDGNTFSFCSGEALELKVTGSFTAYDWSTGETTSSITVTEAGMYTVTTQSPNGCTFTASREVSVAPAPEVIISTESNEIREGQSATLTASGLATYAWETGGTPLGTGESIVVSPLTNTVYGVSGTDTNGCPGHATFELSVREGSIYEKIKPSPFFSPDNGDDFGKYWSVEKITDYPQCEIAVFDIKGIRVYQTTGYNNDWDGTFKGTKLPDGVYYFVIKCPGEENPPKTGSITLLR